MVATAANRKRLVSAALDEYGLAGFMVQIAAWGKASTDPHLNLKIPSSGVLVDVPH